MKKLPLTQGHFALVDNDDYQVLKMVKWHSVIDPRAKRIYARRGIWVDGKQRKILLHNYIMQPDMHQRVLFKDGNGLNCQRANLEVVDCFSKVSAGRRLPPAPAELAFFRKSTSGQVQPQVDPLDEEFNK